MDELIRLWEDVTGDPAETGLVDSFFDRLVFQSESALLRESRSRLGYTKIERFRYVWADSRVLWESRSLYARQRPSSVAPGAPGRRHHPEEYDPWGIEMPGSLPDFQESENEIPVPGSDFIEECGDCGGAGRVVCYHCGGARQVTCDSCGGYGRFTCNDCGGRGEVRCAACGGYGRVKYFDYGANAELTKPCSYCGSHGSVTCDSCGGSGVLICNKCRGAGRITCPTCGGDGDLVCDTCEGEGALIFDVVNRQKYRCKSARASVSNLTELFNRFPEYQFSTATPSPPILTFREEGSLPPPQLERYFSAEELERFARIQAVTDVLERSREGTEHLVRQGLELFMKELYYVHFRFLDQDYECLIDPVAASIHFDRHPFHDLLNAQLRQLSALRELKSYQEFHILSQKILELAGKEPPFQEQAKACKKERSQVHLHFFLRQLPGVLGGYLLVTLIFLLLRGTQWLSGQLLLPLLTALAASGLIGSLWHKLPCAGEKQFRLSGLGLGAVTGSLVTLLFCLAFL